MNVPPSIYAHIKHYIKRLTKPLPLHKITSKLTGTRGKRWLARQATVFSCPHALPWFERDHRPLCTTSVIAMRQVRRMLTRRSKQACVTRPHMYHFGACCFVISLLAMVGSVLGLGALLRPPLLPTLITVDPSGGCCRRSSTSLPSPCNPLLTMPPAAL